MKILFDMDGTIADLYSVENWLPKLRAEDPSPYLEAKPLCNMAELTRLCEMLQYLGYEIGIVSWCSKQGTAEYNAAVRKAKRTWLKQHFPIKFDEIHIVKYGTPKYRFCSVDCVLIDDEQPNREKWQEHGGIAMNPVEEEITTFLRHFLADEI